MLLDPWDYRFASVVISIFLMTLVTAFVQLAVMFG